MVVERGQELFIIAGLGNPGRSYRGNRHNIGFMVLDQVAEELNVTFSKMKREALFTRARVGDHRLLLVKPQTYMNHSGRAVQAYLQFHKCPPDHLLVVYDDVDLPFEHLRLKPGGGAGGQKGMRSIINAVGTEEFPRLRVGIGRPPGRMPVSAYVLRDFSPQEQEVLPFLLDDAVQGVLAFVKTGIHKAMTRINRDPD